MYRSNLLRTACLAAPTIALLVAPWVRPAMAEPGDVLLSDGPGLSTPELPQGTPAANSYAVDPKSGALTYSYPITVPPARNGLEPSLALTYSSNGAMRGGIASGWDLDLPVIKRDMAKGRLYAQTDPTGFDNAWVTTLGAGGQLVPVTESPPPPSGMTAYRAMYDSSYTRYWRSDTGVWEAHMTNGLVYRFGEAGVEVPGMGLVETEGDAHSEWLPLTSVEDPFGNKTVYEWEPVYYSIGFGWLGVDLAIETIHYTSNDAANLAPHAQVVFNYTAVAACPGSEIPTGAFVDFKYYDSSLTSLGALIRGSRRLDSIQTQVYEGGGWRDVRAVDLSYTDVPCSGTLESPVRRLTSITEHGDSPLGVTTYAPTITFGYGPRTLQRTEDITGSPPLGSPVGFPANDLITWGNSNRIGGGPGDRPASIEGQFIDFYGDGTPALVGASKVGSQCHVWDYLPTLTWGGTGFPEECTFSYQLIDADNRGFSWPFMGTSELHVRHYSYLDYHFVDVDGDRLLDLVTTIKEDRNFYSASLDPAVPTYPYASPPCALSSQSEYVETWPEGCEGGELGIARWYRNTGSGFDLSIDAAEDPNHFFIAGSLNSARGQAFWELPADIQPSEAGKQWRQHNQNSASIAYFTDWDGDSFPDVVSSIRGGPGGVFTLGAWIWQGHDQVTMGTEVQSDLIPGSPTVEGSGYSHNTARVIDMNGDGLVDSVSTLDDWGDQLFVYFNYGEGFLEDPAIELRSVTSGVASLDYLVIDGTTSPPSPGDLYSTREYQHRTLDLDGDGLADFLWNDGGVVKVRWNTGGDWTADDTTLGSDPVLVEALKNKAFDGEGVWGVTSDIMDINGDGFPEYIDDGTVLSVPTAQVANAGILHTIDNGAGQLVTIDYALSYDSTVVTGSLQRVGRQRVVKSIEVEDFWSGASDGTTTYTYDSGKVNADDYGRWNFRGFSTVRMTSPTGAVTVDSFDYSDDFRGRNVETVVYMSAADADITPVGNSLPVSVTTRGWNDYSALGVTVYQGDRTEEYTCGTGQTKDACLSSGDLRTRETGFVQFAGGVWVPRDQLDYAGSTPTGPEYRKTETTYQFDAGLYRLQPEWVEQRAWDVGAGALTLTAQTHNIYDPELKQLDQQQVNVARPGAGTEWAITDYRYDQQTGNLIERIKPQQYADHGETGPSETYVYDANKLFVISTTNELGHVVDTVTDLGTGVVLETLGPNSKSGQQGAVKESVETVIDGLGRPIQTYVTVDDATLGYRKELVERITYTNMSGGQLPASKLVERRIDYGGAEWVTDLFEYDGAGRAFRLTDYNFGEAQDGVTNFFYDPSSKLVSMYVPDPSSPGGPQVTYQYLRDPLGRLTGVRNPIGTGVDIIYNGLVTTRTEFNPGAGAGDPIASRIVYDNVFGQTTRVDEKLDVGWAATDYTYHGDRLVRVVDADGIDTSLAHDLSGRRFQISQGTGESWYYGYDRNGNMETITSPNPMGEGDPMYTTSVVYDDLDRAESRDPAPRDLTGGQLFQFGVGLTDTIYDVGENGIGRATRVEYPYGVDVDFDHDGRGNVEVETYTMDLSPSLGAEFAGVYTIVRAFNARNAATQITHADGVVTRTLYDRRGRPDRLEWSTSDGWRVLADFTRNTAGVVTNRTSDFDQSQTWTYTQLGQLLDTDVFAHGASVAGQDYSFYGMGDVQSLTHQNYSGTHSKSFTYDTRHQLDSASGSLGAYAWDFSYTPGGRLDTAQLDHDGSLDAPERWVQYERNDPAHPAAVTALDQISPGSGMRAAFFYDDAGNREVSDGFPTEYYEGNDLLLAAYDGDNQLRSIEQNAGPYMSELHYYAGPGSRLLRADYDRASSTVTKLTAYIGATEIDFDSLGNPTTTRSRLPLSGTAAARISDSSDVELTYQSPLGHVIEAWGENRFAGVSAYASSQFYSYAASNVIDGSTSTYWYANSTYGWVYVNLGSAQQVDRITLHGGVSIGSYKLQYWDSGAGWVTFDNDSLPGDYKQHSFSPITAKWWRLEILDKNPAWFLSIVGLSEFRFYDTAEQRFSAVYDAFGEELQVLDVTSDHFYRFNGKERSQLSRYHYYGYRHYDPLSMVWTQGDPMYRFVPELAFDEPRRLGLYTFDLNNPLRYVDPDGQDPKLKLHVVDKTRGSFGWGARTLAIYKAKQSLNKVAAKSDDAVVKEGFSTSVRTTDFSKSEIKSLSKSDFVVYLHPTRADTGKAVRTLSRHTGPLSSADETQIEAQLSTEGGVNLSDHTGKEGLGAFRVATDRQSSSLLDRLLGGNVDHAAAGIVHEGPGHTAIDGHSASGVMREGIPLNGASVEFSTEDEPDLLDDWKNRVHL